MPKHWRLPHLALYVNVNYIGYMADIGTHATLHTPDHQDRHVYSISDLSSEFDVTARALRFYEDEGLIAPIRRGTTRFARNIHASRARSRLV